MNSCKGCKWLSHVKTIRNYTNTKDIDVYYCLEPEHLENQGYEYMTSLYGCYNYTNIQLERRKKLDKICKE